MAMLEPEQIMSAIETVMREVPNVGIVHQYRRTVRDEQSASDLMFDEAQTWICGWMISPAPINTLMVERSMGYNAIGGGGGDAMETSSWQIEGYFGHSDERETEKTFHKLAIAIVRQLNKYGKLPGVSGLVLQNAANLEQFSYVMFALMFHLHYARITISFRGTARF
jgi:hypothetical protein